MSFNPLVSCIVPVYNAAKYLSQGIESLLAQTHKNLEIILVDDWSTDDSWSICQVYAQKYSNIRTYRNKSNSGGPLRGREYGIKEAQGEWVTFMDCDDYVKPQYIENLLKVTDKGSYDIAVTGYSSIHPDGTIEDFIWENYSQTTDERLKSFYKHYFVDRNFWTDPTDTAGQSLIRASVAKKTDLSKYPNVVLAEDTLMALAFLANSKNGVNFVDYHDFYWRQIEGSGSHGGFTKGADEPAFYRASYDIFHKHKLLPTVSIIIPVYNVERYLTECLESVLAQTYPALDIILVDDASTDASSKLADELVQHDERIKVIHKLKNEGLNMARSTGFLSSIGEYVSFVDSDDLLTETFVEVGVRAIKKNKADFARLGVITFKDKTNIPEIIRDIPGNGDVVLTTKKELFEKSVGQGLITVWGVMYTRESVDKIDWKEINYRVYEDNIWTLRLLEGVSSGVYSSHTGYLYRFDDTITNVLSKKLTGNSLNGAPVGYLEFITILEKEYDLFNEKYELHADAVIKATNDWHWNHRTKNITRADGWVPEATDTKYVSNLLNWLARKTEELESQASFNQNNINALEYKVSEKNKELSSFLGVKRSARLLAGNVKRKINKNKRNGAN